MTFRARLGRFLDHVDCLVWGHHLRGRFNANPPYEREVFCVRCGVWRATAKEGA